MAPAYAGLTYGWAFQQASFSGIRTALMPRFFIVVMDACPLGPSKMPCPCTHWYSVPERFTPCSPTCRPLALTSSLPDTCTCGAAPGWGGFGCGDDDVTRNTATAPMAMATARMVSRTAFPSHQRGGPLLMRSLR